MSSGLAALLTLWDKEPFSRRAGCEKEWVIVSGPGPVAHTIATAESLFLVSMDWCSMRFRLLLTLMPSKL